MSAAKSLDEAHIYTKYSCIVVLNLELNLRVGVHGRTRVLNKFHNSSVSATRVLKNCETYLVPGTATSYQALVSRCLRRMVQVLIFKYYAEYPNIKKSDLLEF